MIVPTIQKDLGEEFGIGSTIVRAALQGMGPFLQSLKGFPPTSAMKLGTAVHSLLAGGTVEEGFLTVPALNKAKAMAHKVESLHLLPKGAILELQTEINFIKHKDTQFYLKATPDYYHEGEGLLVDYKTTKMVAMTDHEIRVALVSSKTYVQLAFYNELFFLKTGKKATKVGVYYISNSSSTMHEVNCKLVWLDNEWLEQGLKEAIEGIQLVKDYITSDFAVDYDAFTIESFPAPAWLYNKLPREDL